MALPGLCKVVRKHLELYRFRDTDFTKIIEISVVFEQGFCYTSFVSLCLFGG